MNNFNNNGLSRFPHVLKCGYRSSITKNVAFKIIKKEVKKWNSKKETKRKYCDNKSLSSFERTVLGYLPSFLHPIWLHPTGKIKKIFIYIYILKCNLGIKTIFFWAPTAKLVRPSSSTDIMFKGLVIESLSDLE